jgi:ketosteroid isomerase-like protein
MPGENAARFEELVLAFNRLARSPAALDPDALETLLGVMDPEVRFAPQQAAIEGGYVGHQGVLQWLIDLAQSYETGRFDCTDIRQRDDRVLALGTLEFTGRGSGIDTEARVAIVATFRAGLVTDFKDYGAEAPALEAMGPAENA